MHEVEALLGRWTLKSALLEKQSLIQARVNKEAEVEWALGVEEPFAPIVPLKVEKWSVAPLWAFARSVLP